MSVPIPRKLWEHPNPESTTMGKFRRELERATGQRFNVRTRTNITDTYISKANVQLKWQGVL